MELVQTSPTILCLDELIPVDGFFGCVDGTGFVDNEVIDLAQDAVLPDISPLIVLDDYEKDIVNEAVRDEIESKFENMQEKLAKSARFDLKEEFESDLNLFNPMAPEFFPEPGDDLVPFAATVTDSTVDNPAVDNDNLAPEFEFSVLCSFLHNLRMKTYMDEINLLFSLCEDDDDDDDGSGDEEEYGTVLSYAEEIAGIDSYLAELRLQGRDDDDLDVIELKDLRKWTEAMMKGPNG